MSASKWKPYPEYRDPHIDWIGKIPKHWQVLRSKYVFSEKDERSISGKEELLGLSKSKGIVRKKEMEQRSSVSNTYVGYKKCVKGDIVMNKLQAWNGVLDVSNYNGIVSPDYTVFEISEEVDKYYGTFLLKSPLFVAQLGRNSKGIGSGFMRLYTDYFGDIEFLLPPTEEQMSISKFIQKIDIIGTSIQQQLEEKLELLEEKRSALITQAVTKGLNPDVPMKDTCVKWLSEIPTHWQDGLVKRFYKVDLGKMLDSKKQTGDSKPYLRAANIHWDKIRLDSVNQMGFTKKQQSHYRLKKGDLLVTEGGHTVGRSAIWYEDFECYYQNSLNRVRSKSFSEEKYLHYIMFHLKLSGYVNMISDTATFAHLTKEKLEALTIPMPPIEEQKMIISSLDDFCKKVDLSKLIIEDQIAHLKEYRTALISAAVTGKIDVRESD